MAELHIVTVLIRGTTQTLGFNYTDHDRARAAYEALTGSTNVVEVNDDFGTFGCLNIADIAGVVFMNYEKQLEGQHAQQELANEVSARHTPPSQAIIQPNRTQRRGFRA